MTKGIPPEKLISFEVGVNFNFNHAFSCFVLLSCSQHGKAIVAGHSGDRKYTEVSRTQRCTQSAEHSNKLISLFILLVVCTHVILGPMHSFTFGAQPTNLHRYKVFGQQRLDCILTWIDHPSHCPWRYCVRPLPRAKDWKPTLRAQLVEQ